jgi:hypothetical protein
VLSGRDLIVDIEAVRQYLETSLSEGARSEDKAICMNNRNGKARITTVGIEDTGARTGGQWAGSGFEVLWFEDLDHAQVFDCEKTRSLVVKAVRSYSTKGRDHPGFG